MVGLQTVALVLLVELLVYRHHLCVGAGLNVVPGSWVVLPVPDNIGATSQSGNVPVVSKSVLKAPFLSFTIRLLELTMWHLQRRDL